MTFFPHFMLKTFISIGSELGFLKGLVGAHMKYKLLHTTLPNKVNYANLFRKTYLGKQNGTYNKLYVYPKLLFIQQTKRIPI